MKKFIIVYHFADNINIRRIIESEDEKSALSIATTTENDAITFTDSKGVMYHFYMKDVVFTSVTEYKP